jgi:cell division septum initiation protein DivIVA
MVEKTKGVDKPNQDVIKQMEQVAENIHNTTKSRIEKPMIDATTFFNNMRQNKEKENERILLECKR